MNTQKGGVKPASASGTQNIKPVVSQQVHSYYNELAETGQLYDFLQSFMDDEFRSNPEFHRSMLQLMMDNFTVSPRGVQEEYLGFLSQSLKKFIEKMQHATTVDIKQRAH